MGIKLDASTFFFYFGNDEYHVRVCVINNVEIIKQLHRKDQRYECLSHGDKLHLDVFGNQDEYVIFAAYSNLK